ncbi:S8 family serine peptidase [Phytohabitans houttuyneae]|uniref:S8 family serine peptidase n=1 Tax=Phytohabitans houttuyneae TaxID=1076126 RepID=UPI0031EFB10D
MAAAGIAAAVVAASGAVAQAAPPRAEAPPPPAGAPAGADKPERRHTVMLLTGDRVTYTVAGDGRRAVTVLPAPRPGAEQVRFSTSQAGEHYYVIPSDAQARVAAGTLDRALFDIPLLVADGQATADRPAGVILRYGSAAVATGTGAALPGADRKAALRSINGNAVRSRAGRAHETWGALRGGRSDARTLDRGVASVSLDRIMRPALDVSVIQTGAPFAWAAGYRGSGIKVAVLDTGIDLNHPDVTGRIVSTANFTGEATVADGHGHGTHVASTVAGNGAASAQRFRGMAPEASLMVGKVLDSGGNGAMSQVIQGMEWAARNGARVINLSLGAGPSDGTDPASEAVNALSAETGALFVIASGNNHGDASVNAPGAATAALTVGATDKVGGFVDFSNRGPRRGDGAVKPEIAAPGYEIVAARAAGTSMGTPYDANYTSASGTSMATPHVAGAAVLLAQAHPTWSADRIKDELVSTAEPRDAQTVFTAGSGWVDVRRALGQRVSGPEAVDFGLVQPPYTQVRTRTLTYRNDTTAAVTLGLTVSGRGWDGRALPTGAIALSASTVTVPAGGTAAVTMTFTAAPGDPGAYAGIVTAASADGTIRVRSPFSYYKGGVRTLDVPVLDSRGRPVPGVLVTIAKLDGPTHPNDPITREITQGYTGDDGVASFSVADGVYDVYAWQTEWEADKRRANQLQRIEVPISANTTVTLDARQARRVNPTLPESTNQLVGMAATTRRLASGDTAASGGMLSWENWDVYVTPTGTPAVAGLEAFEQWTLGSTQVQVRANGGAALPVDYHPYMNGRTLARFQNTTLPLVYAGGGTPAEYTAAGATGKVALVRIVVPAGTVYTGGYVWNAMEAARLNAASEGVAGIIAYTDMTGGIAMPLRDDNILALSLPAASGQALRTQVASGAVQLAITAGRANPERVFQLRYQHTTGVPATAPAVDPAQLVSYPAKYRADKAGLTYTSAWPVFGENDTSATALGVSYWAPMDWTEYAGPRDSRLTWTQTVYQRATLEADPIGDQNAWYKFLPGESRSAEDWFGPVIRTVPAEVPDGYPFRLRCTFCREGDTFVTGYYEMDADGRHFDTTAGDNVVYRMFRSDGSTIPVSALNPTRFTLPATAGTFRLEAVETQRGLGPVRVLGQRSTTDWTFRSAPQATSGRPAGYRCFSTSDESASCAFQPLVQLRYQFAGLDSLNRAAAGETFTFDVVAGAHRLTPGAAPATSLTLSSSTNGGSTWQPAQVSALGSGRFRVTVTHPALSATDGYVWLRTQAQDAAGNQVTQTLERAYSLRQGATPPACEVKYEPNSWQTGFTANVQIKNTGTATVNGWNLAWRFAGNQQITNAWNGVPTQTGQQVSVVNTASNATISPSGTVSFGFQATYSGVNAVPDAFTLNGAPCVKV